MPLSEEELRLLEQMERALTEEDPKFASTLRGSSFRRSARRRALLAGVAFVGGVALMMTSAVANLIPVAVLGFVVMLVSATYALSVLRARPVQPVNDQSSLHDRMDRWRHRHED
jgi:poly(A) polymerase Pap1